MVNRQADTVTLAEAARLVGRAPNTVRKRLADGELAAARNHLGEWEIAVEALASLWPRQTWPDDDHDDGGDASLTVWMERVLDAEQRATRAEVGGEALGRELEQLRRQAHQLRSDLEHERARAERTAVDAEVATRAAEALEAQLQQLRIEVSQALARADQHAAAVAEARRRAGMAEAQSDEVRRAWRSDVDLLRERADEVAGHRARAEATVEQLRGDLDGAVLAMGWWSRRRWQRRRDARGR